MPLEKSGDSRIAHRSGRWRTADALAIERNDDVGLSSVLQLMGGEHDCSSTLCFVTYDVEDVCLRGYVESRGWFVEQENRRVLHDALGH